MTQLLYTYLIIGEIQCNSFDFSFKVNIYTDNRIWVRQRLYKVHSATVLELRTVAEKHTTRCIVFFHDTIKGI